MRENAIYMPCAIVLGGFRGRPVLRSRSAIVSTEARGDMHSNFIQLRSYSDQSDQSTDPLLAYVAIFRDMMFLPFPSKLRRI
jgi:hypothetical protein